MLFMSKDKRAIRYKQKNILQDKRGTESLLTEITFSILILVAVVILFLFVSSKSGDFRITEQVYAKQIALLIDQAKPGTKINLEISSIFEIAQKNKFSGETIFIDDNNKKVTIRLAEGKGYSIDYFNDAGVSGYVDKRAERLMIEIK